MNRIKWFILGCFCVLVVGFTSFDTHPILPRYATSPSVRWESIGNLTAVQSTLAVGSRDYTAVWTTLSDAKTIKWDVPSDASGVEFRFETDANGNAHVVELWVSASNTLTDRESADSFTLGTTLTLTGG